MTCYKVELKKSAEKSLLKLPKPVIAKVIYLLQGLVHEPRPNGCKKLTGSTNTYRIRTGDYRVVYSIFDDVLTIDVIKIGHRKEIYKN
ncbi:type II toxin-antitoxin system RelE family toxin [methanotrophic endosymbiont of Bathymodiolus puteoserpentis (Logatchev)]|jgi:mRNA interferase RelE/StbE|uniref:type II toxin-antitoxin system RelE family toxin n=1 Tax=methanotrophic endosymbiont of Bathymodiolus puteoserpentis (Logatchev) TaxID=343235 RepID=UPI00157A9D82|nr:type II toxin-antitoxin system RelE/ParE family toxin [methanotrophic endosymbiont of Bathymodiolus puteoserpentis (Logatchev)]